MLYEGRVPPDDISNFASGEKVTVTGIVDEPVTHYSQRVAAILRTSIVEIGNSSIPVSGRIKLSIYDRDTDIEYGDAVRFTARLKKIRGFNNPGLFNYAGYVSRKGIRASTGISNKEGIVRTGEYGNPLLKKIYRWREKIRLSIIRGLSESSSAVLQAMVIGTTGDLTPELRDRFTAAGVTHILSISGSHLGFVTLLSFFIARYLLTRLPCRIFLRMTMYATPSKSAAIVTMPPVIFYSFLSGGEVATIRSLIMAIVFLLAILIERDDDPVNTLATAAILVLAWNPQGLFDISFQLSYTAVLSMIVSARIFHARIAGQKAAKGLYGWRQRIILLLILTVSATVSTAPIVAHYFNQITWAGFLSNMVIIPYAGFTVVPIGLLTGCLGLVLNADVIPFAQLNELLMTIFLRMADLFAGIPFAVIHTPSPDILSVSFLYLFLISLFFLNKKWARAASVISISFMTVIIACGHLNRHDNETMRVTFLDVGQGDSAIMEFPGGKLMIIDGGGTFSSSFDMGRSVVAPYLWNKGIRKIDYMVLSHPQRDHAGGLIYLLDTFHVGEVWTNGMTSPATCLFDRIIREKGITHLKVSKNTDDKTIGGCIVQVLNPPPIATAPGSSNPGLINNLSVVLRIGCKDGSILFTGDIEEEQMKKIAAGGPILRSNIIKVPHHGAAGSVDSRFMSSVNPSIAVISAGYQNSYGHPSPEVVSSYETSGSAIYRTDQDGAVIVTAWDGKTGVITYRDTLLKKISFDGLASLTDSELTNLKMTMEGCCNGGL